MSEKANAPSHDQAIRIRKMYESGKLNREAVAEVMSEEKSNQKERWIYTKKVDTNMEGLI